MDDLFENSSSTKRRFQTAVWTVKLSFLFIGIVSTGLLLKLAVPYSLNLLLSSVPRLWISFRSWLSPPYLYILVNFIIIGIAASSSFQQQKPSELKSSSDENSEVENNAQPRKQIDATKESSSSQKESLGLWTGNDYIASGVGHEHEVITETSPEFSTESWSETSCLTDSDTASEVNRKVRTSRSVTRNASVVYRGVGKSMATSAEKVVLEPVGVARANKHDDESMEATWNAITGQGKPLTRQLKKSDTWDVPPQVKEPEPEPEPEPVPKSVLSRRELRKSETFNDTASTSSSSSSGSASSRGSVSGGGLRRELVLSQDELNRRVEAFIKKFNNEMRLQRQESYKRHMDTVNRAVY